MKISKSIALSSFALLSLVSSSVAVRPAFAIGKTMQGITKTSGPSTSQSNLALSKTMMGHMTAAEQRTFAGMSKRERALMMKMMRANR